MNIIQLFLFSFIVLFSFCKEQTTPITITDNKMAAPTKIEPVKTDSKNATVVIQTKFGNIKIKLFSDVAPKHVDSFLSLIKQGFYNGTTFHRVIPGFMIQGGDPNSKDPNKRETHGTGGPGYTVPAEFSQMNHKRGIVSAARAQNPNSAGSQFFICVKDSPFLDGKYSIFGEVIEGMEVADQIVSQPRDPNDNPNERIEMKISVE